MSKRSSLKFLFFLGALVGLTGLAQAADVTPVPQASEPDAWQSSRQNREQEQPWYELGEVPHPDACQYSRANREACDRWYALQGEKACVTIKIDQVIHFEFDKAVIRPESYGILDDVAKVIRDNPRIKR